MNALTCPHLRLCLWLWLGVALGLGQGQGKDMGGALPGDVALVSAQPHPRAGHRPHSGGVSVAYS